MQIEFGPRLGPRFKQKLRDVKESAIDWGIDKAVRYLPTGLRRDGVGRLFQFLLPTEYRVLNEADKKLLRLQHQGFSTIECYPHSTNDDVPTNQEVQYPRYHTLREKPIVVPIARHQVNRTLVRLAKLTDLQLNQIITPHTIRARKNYDEHGKKIRDSGKKQYYDHAREAFGEGGTVFLAPAAERQTPLSHFRGDALPQLLEETKDTKNVVLAFFGHEIKGVTDYKSVKDKNQFGKKHVVTLGYVYTREEFTTLTQKYDISTNDLAFILLSDLSPAALQGPDFLDNPKYQSIVKDLKQAA